MSLPTVFKSSLFMLSKVFSRIFTASYLPLLTFMKDLSMSTPSAFARRMKMSQRGCVDIIFEEETFLCNFTKSDVVQVPNSSSKCSTTTHLQSVLMHSGTNVEKRFLPKKSLFTEIDQILDGLYLIGRTLKHFQSFSFPLEGIT